MVPPWGSLNCLASGARLVHFARHLTPQANVSDAFVVARHYDFRSFRDRAAGFAARAADTARSHLRIDQLAGATFANRHGQFAQHTHHFEVRRVQVLLVRDQDFSEKQKNDCSADQPGNDRKQQRRAHPEGGESREQITGSSKPRQEGRYRRRIKRRYTRTARDISASRRISRSRDWRVTCCRRVPYRRMGCRHVSDAVPVKVGQMQTSEPGTAKYERKKTEAKADCETNQIKV